MHLSFVIFSATSSQRPKGGERGWWVGGGAVTHSREGMKGGDMTCPTYTQGTMGRGGGEWAGTLGRDDQKFTSIE